MSDQLVVGLDLREVAASPRGYRRMMNWVYELDGLESGLAIRLISKEAESISRHTWTDRTSRFPPQTLLRMMHRPLLGNLRRLIWGDIKVMHFLTGDVWYAPSCRTIVTLHDLAPMRFPQFFFNNKQEEDRYRSHINKVFDIADQVVTVSEWSAGELSEFFPIGSEKIRVIHQGVDPAFRPTEWSGEARALFSRNVAAGEDCLLYCGGIDARKNLSFLLDAFRIYCDNTREPRKLVIVGDPHTRKLGMDPPEKLVEDRSLSDSVVFTGQISDELLRRLYCAAGLFIYPSKMEGFGYSPLEAMACGCPVLCSNSAALPETVGEAAHLLPPEDPEVWADEIGLLIEDEKRREELVKEGFEQIKKYSWKTCAEEFLELYQSVSGGNA